MKRESHRILGNYLMEQMKGLPAYRYQKAFLFGCTQPDSNPFTYLKGSRRAQRLRGHNYRNAERCMSRMARLLEAREQWRMLDYYRLGKLIHYPSDAFTYAHNETFDKSIHEHRLYEMQLQRIFKITLALSRRAENEMNREEESAMEAIRAAHERYMEGMRSLQTDVQYILGMTHQVFSTLIPEAA